MADHAPSTSSPGNVVVDVGYLLDQGQFTPRQGLIVFFIALTIIMDGVDNQLLSYALPYIMQEWAYTGADFAIPMMVSPIGMIFGSLFCGFLSDKIGRRWLVLGTLALCGVATCLLGLATTPSEMIIWRFLTGCAIGGALPVCTTLASEFAPLRYRTMIVTISIVCVPLGGTVAGFISRPILTHFNWQMVFFVGGLIPLILFSVLIFTLPESPRFLCQHPKRWLKLRQILHQLQRDVGNNCHFIDQTGSETQNTQKVGFLALFHSGRAVDSIALCLSFFFCMIAIYGCFYWLPTMLVEANVPAVIAGYSLTVYNIGGVLGSLLCGLAISFLGSRRALGICATLGALSVFSLMWFDVGVQGHIMLMLFLIGLHGLFVNAVQSTLYALPAHIYPTSIRATGTATAAACGRIGAIATSSLSILYLGQINIFFLTLGLVMLCVLGALLILRHHIPAIGLRQKNRPEKIFE